MELFFLLSIVPFLTFISPSFLCILNRYGNVNVSKRVITAGDVEKLFCQCDVERERWTACQRKVSHFEDGDYEDDGNSVVLNSINNDVDDILVSQLLIKATYFL